MATVGSAHDLRVVFHHSKKHRVVHDNVELSSTHGSKLTEHNVLRYTAAVIELTEAGSLEKNLDSLLEGTTHESSSIIAVDSVTRDGHEETTLRHDVDEERHVTVVDVGAVEG